jgi:hypothetical protein
MAIFLRNIFLTVAVLLAAVAAPRAAEMTREQWTADIIQNLPLLFCNEGRYYRVCYEVDRGICENAVAAAVQSCIDARNEELPQTFTDALNSRWSGIMEKCVDEEYSEMFINQKKDAPTCSQSER